MTEETFSMKIAVLRETYPGERRVALVPANLSALKKAGLEVVIESGAGESAGFRDKEYVAQGAAVATRAEALRAAEIVAQVRTFGTNPQAGRADLALLEKRHMLVGTCDPLGAPQAAQDIAQTGATLFSLELIPRITRAQSMDVLSSQATVAGYRAVLMAASELHKMFPLLMTAAGTVKAARVFVIGAGVAGLQALATARRLGAAASAYDVRPACREQVESLGGKFVELRIDSRDAEDKGGYAKALGDEFYRRQQELMAEVVGNSDVVITTAAIPGKPSPLLVTADAVRRMAPGSVIVDLAAERGGNCELTRADQRVVDSGVIILGPTNPASDIPQHASQMFGTNVTHFLVNLVKQGGIEANLDDEIVRETLVTRQGEVVHARVRELLGISAAADPAPPAPAALPDSAEAKL
jgi:NAD(P) transhydrogenase subunit alpha